MVDHTRVLDEMPESVSLSATTKTLSIKVSKASMTGRYTVENMHEKFLEKLTWAYSFENMIKQRMPNMFNHHVELVAMNVENKDASNDEQWEIRNKLIRTVSSFNLLFRIYATYKTSKSPKIRNKREAVLKSLLALDDIEMWEGHYSKNIYSANDLIKWYNKNIEPIEAILIDPDSVGEIE